jgi:hypothetical protein
VLNSGGTSRCYPLNSLITAAFERTDSKTKSSRRMPDDNCVADLSCAVLVEMLFRSLEDGSIISISGCANEGSLCFRIRLQSRIH